NKKLKMKNSLSSNEIHIECYTDSSWADNYDFRTTMGHIIFLNGIPILWKSNIDKSKIQKSSCEAEYISVSKPITHVIAIESLLKELLPDTKFLVTIYTDNEAVKILSKVMLLNNDYDM